jgi:cell division septum initiation protein DivIVA
MFLVEKFIDTVQNSKKQFVETFVKQEQIRDSLNEFIDAQTEYTKSVWETMTKIGKTTVDETGKAVKEMSTYDWSKLAELTKTKSK